MEPLQPGAKKLTDRLLAVRIVPLTAQKKSALRLSDLIQLRILVLPAINL